MFRWSSTSIRLSFVGGVLLSLAYLIEARPTPSSYSTSTSISTPTPISTATSTTSNNFSLIATLILVGIFTTGPTLCCCVCYCVGYERRQRLKMLAKARAKAKAQAPAAATRATPEEIVPMIVPTPFQYPPSPEPRTFDYPRDFEAGRSAPSTSSSRMPEAPEDIYGPPPEYTEPYNGDIAVAGGSSYTYPPPSAPPDRPKYSLKSDV